MLEAGHLVTVNVLLATENRAKQAKLRWLVERLGLTLHTPDEVGLAGFDVAETGGSHRDIAEQKATAWSRESGMAALASDGGAVIPALGDAWNSLFTRRAAGTSVDDVARADHLLSLMHDRDGGERDVIWVEAIALARAGVILGSWEAAGSLGRLARTYDPAQIRDGFWFPALIVVSSLGKRYADLTSDERAETADAWNELRQRIRPELRALDAR